VLNPESMLQANRTVVVNPKRSLAEESSVSVLALDIWTSLNFFSESTLLTEVRRKKTLKVPRSLRSDG
jgi:hypothetical protein